MKTLLFFFLIVQAIEFASAQKFELPQELKEISGLEQLDENTLLAINDGGNSNELFVISTAGRLIRKVVIANATNEDWEDLAADEDYLYIADFGNNLNKRKDLCIYKVNLYQIRTEDTVRAEKISFSYEEQGFFPPEQSKKFFDAEALIWLNGKLVILTKTNNEPWTGESYIYEVPTIPGSYSLGKSKGLIVGEDGWYKDAITAADAFGGKVYFSTYNRIVECDEALNECTTIHTYEESTQKESLIAFPHGFFVADERQTFLGGGYLYKIEKK